MHKQEATHPARWLRQKSCWQQNVQAANGRCHHSEEQTIYFIWIPTCAKFWGLSFGSLMYFNTQCTYSLSPVFKTKGTQTLYNGVLLRAQSCSYATQMLPASDWDHKETGQSYPWATWRGHRLPSVNASSHADANIPKNARWNTAPKWFFFKKNTINQHLKAQSTSPVKFIQLKGIRPSWRTRKEQQTVFLHTKRHNDVSLDLPQWVSSPLVWIQHVISTLETGTGKHLKDLTVQTLTSLFSAPAFLFWQQC